MIKPNVSFLLLFCTLVLSAVVVMQTAVGQSDLMTESEEQRNALVGTSLVSLWTSGDPEVADKVCFMYTYNAKKLGWFDHVTLIVWGPSAQLLATNSSLQAQIQPMLNEGVVIQACKACADSYGVSQDLQNLGIEVKYMGLPLTNMLKQDRKVLTF